MEISANDLLQQYDIQSLQQMARAHDLKLSGNKKATFVSALTKTIYDPARIARALADLSAAERTMLDRVILSGGETTTALLRRQLEGDGVVDPPQRTTRYGFSYYERERGSYRNRNSRKFEDLIARLGAHGLAFAIGPSRGARTMVSLQEPGSRLIIPDEILKHLPAATLTLEVAAEPEEVRPGDAAALLRDLYLLFSIVDREKIALTNRGLVMKRSLTRIGQVLGRENEVAVVKSEDQLAGFSLLRGLAQALGLLAASVGELLLDPRGELFLKLPANDRHQRLWDAYQTTTDWSELHRIPDLTVRGKGLTIYSPPANVVPARQRVLAELRELPAGQWIPIEHLISRLRMRAYEFLFSRTPAANSFYAVNYHYHGFGYYNPYHSSINGLGVTLDIDDEGRGWNVAEAGFVRVVVTEALHALGVVDLGGDGAEVTVFRITDVGRRLLAGEPLAAEETPAQVVVQPNFQVFAFQPTGEDVLFMLDRIADRVRTGQAMEYELTQASIFRAQQAGLETAAIVEFLERVSTHELPQNVRRTLEEWGAQHERITLRKRAPVLQTTTEAALDALYADEALAPYLGRRLAPTLALVPTEQLRFVYHRMIDHGLLATLSEGPMFQPGPQLHVDGDGSLRFRHAQPSIFALHELRPFADDVDARPRLTSDSLRRGAKAGLDADAIIAILERLSGGTLADEPAALIRRWAKDWGGGAIYDATILQLDKPEQLADLLADPQVRPHLQPIPGAPTLAIVPPKSRKRVRELLEARGMVLGEQPGR